MKKLILIVWVLAVSVPVLAQPVAFEYMPKEISFNYMSSRSFYSCEYVRQEARLMLNQLGVEATKMFCPGAGVGMQRNIWLKIEALVPVADEDGSFAGQWVQEKIRFREACDLHFQMMLTFLKHVPTASVVRRGACRDSQGSMTYTVEVIKEVQ